uniref:C2H2-type domain-containing protein n=1 Tax=Physcomitrium patens TaxID=3218 RepID=A0A7I4A9V9_PHYPA
MSIRKCALRLRHKLQIQSPFSLKHPAALLCSISYVKETRSRHNWYFMTCACVDYWAIMLPQLESLSGLQAVALHGKMKQDSEEGIRIYSEENDSSVRPAEESNSNEAAGDNEDSKGGEGSPRERFKCVVCGITPLKPSLLKQHLRAHSAERPFSCSFENCGRQYKRQDHLNRHLLTHKGNLFFCTWEGCDLSFNVNANLQRHLRLHKKWDSNVLRGTKVEDNARLTCSEPGCGKVFKYPSLLQTHIESVHDSSPVTQGICVEPGCGEIFDSLSQLKAHIKVAHCYVVCETCGVSMLKNKLKSHTQTHEGVQTLIRCPHPGCVHSYTKKSNLDTHIRVIHQNVKPYDCSHAGCEMRFAYKVVRDKHEKSGVHAQPELGGNFEAEDLEFSLKSRGGRKRLRLNQVDDLLPRKHVSQPHE